jgi:hypothetical protein
MWEKAKGKVAEPKTKVKSIYAALWNGEEIISPKQTEKLSDEGVKEWMRRWRYLKAMPI